MELQGKVNEEPGSAPCEHSWLFYLELGHHFVQTSSHLVFAGLRSSFPFTQHPTVARQGNSKVTDFTSCDEMPRLAQNPVFTPD